MPSGLAGAPPQLWGICRRPQTTPLPGKGQGGVLEAIPVRAQLTVSKEANGLTNDVSQCGEQKRTCRCNYVTKVHHRYTCVSADQALGGHTSYISRRHCHAISYEFSRSRSQFCDEAMVYARLPQPYRGAIIGRPRLQGTCTMCGSPVDVVLKHPLRTRA